MEGSVQVKVLGPCGLVNSLAVLVSEDESQLCLDKKGLNLL